MLEEEEIYTAVGWVKPITYLHLFGTESVLEVLPELKD